MNKYISHRGNDIIKCENNINCLKTMNINYIDGIEIDIRNTLDNKLILYHNSFIIDNFKFINISKSKFKVIKNYVITLKYVLKNMNKNKILMLDIKDDIDIDKLYGLVKKYNNIYICSFNYNLMYKLKIKYKVLKVGIIIGYGINKHKKIDIFDFISIHYLYNIYHKNKFIWTVNNKDIINNIYNSNIISDVIYKIKK